MTRFALWAPATVLALAAGCRGPDAAGTTADAAPPWGSGAADSIEGRGELLDEPPFHEGPAASLPAARTPDGQPLKLSDVVGEYSWQSFYSGGSLTVFPDGTWFSTGGSCTTSHWKRGVVRVVDGRLVFETRDREGRLTGRTGACVPVWWGGRICLIDEDDLTRLANCANWGETDSVEVHFSLLATAGAVPELAERSPSGPPLLPREWEHFVLQKPIRGTVTELVEEEIAFVDLGEKDGVFPRMLLNVGSSMTPHFVTVVSVEESRCQIVSWPKRGQALPVGTPAWCDARGAGVPK